MKSTIFILLLAMATSLQAQPRVDPKSTERARVEVAQALSQMAAAANRHDVEGHVGFYAHDPAVTLIVDGERLVGWDTIRDKQREWWKNGDTDVTYSVVEKPDFRVLAPNIVVSTLLLKSKRSLPNGEIKEGAFAVSSVWQRRAERWRVVYSHESTTR